MTPEIEAAVAAVAARHVKRIATPGRWLVWMPDGASKPRVRIYS